VPVWPSDLVGACALDVPRGSASLPGLVGVAVSAWPFGSVGACARGVLSGLVSLCGPTAPAPLSAPARRC